MDTGFVPEGIGADHSLVGLDWEASEVADQPAGAVDLGGVDIGSDVVEVIARAHGHHDLFKGGVARPFADAIDGALYLSGTGANCGDAVCHAQTEVIVAMYADHGLVNVGDVVEDAGDEVVELLRGGVAYGVRVC